MTAKISEISLKGAQENADEILDGDSNYLVFMPTAKPDEDGTLTDDVNFIKFDAKKMVTLLEEGKSEELSLELISILNYFDEYLVTNLRKEDIPMMNILAKLIVMIMVDDKYEIPEQLLLKFIDHNPTISNILRVSDFKNSDIAIKALQGNKNNLFKCMVLYGPRNTVEIDIEQFFKYDKFIASFWWSSVLDYTRNSNSEIIYNNMQKLLRSKAVKQNYAVLSHRGDIPDNMTHANFWTSYIDPNQEEPIKHMINNALKPYIFKTPDMSRADKKKILLVSWFFKKGHAVYKSLSPLIYSLKGHYHITHVALEPTETTEREIIDTELFDEVLYFYKDGRIDTKVIDRMLSGEWGILYLPDVGMNMLSVCIANTRIAPIQIMSYGHPVSTYGSQVDYFIAGRNTEVPDHPERFYSERLVMIPGLGTLPVLPKYELKRPAKAMDRVVISCSWGSVKFNYPHLLRLKKIIERAKNDVVYLFSGLYAKKFSMIPFALELQELLGFEQVITTPQYNYDDYMFLIESSDFGIDSFPFGSYNRIIDTLYCRKPLVALEGDRAYNRLASALYRDIGLEELIATNEEEFVDISVRLIDDEGFRNDLVSKIEKIDLEDAIYNTGNEKYFRKAFEYIIANHEKLQKEGSRKPIIIEKD